MVITASIDAQVHLRRPALIIPPRDVEQTFRMLFDPLLEYDLSRPVRFVIFRLPQRFLFQYGISSRSEVVMGRPPDILSAFFLVESSRILITSLLQLCPSPFPSWVGRKYLE